MKKDPTDSNVVTLRLTPEEKDYLIKVMTERKEYKWQSLLKRLIKEWAARPNDSNVTDSESTRESVPALLPTPLETRYVDPELLALQELTARAWRTQKSDELAKTIVSLLRIYGDIARNITLEGETS